MKNSTVARLQWAHLLLGMMFWYGVEQLFLNKYLHNASSRAYLTMAFTASVLVLDVPCGILADKLGRKLAILAGCMVQALGVLILGASSSLAVYLVGSVVFGLAISLLNGAAQALLYDDLKARQQTDLYAKLQGRVYAFFLVGAAIANLLSGVLATTFGLRAPFFLSAIPSLLAFVILAGIHEPPLLKKTDAWYTHLATVGHELRSRPRILLFGIQFIVSEVVILSVGEFGQIYILQFVASAVVLGLLWSLVALSASAGQFFAHRFRSRPRWLIGAYIVSLVLFAITKSAIGVVLFIVVYGLTEATQLIAEAGVQDNTRSSIRATLFSTVSFAANALAVPIIYIFNQLYLHHSLAAAEKTIAFSAAVLLILTLLLRQEPSPQAIDTATPESPARTI